jgi:hypothetical protein
VVSGLTTTILGAGSLTAVIIAGAAVVITVGPWYARRVARERSNLKAGT